MRSRRDQLQAYQFLRRRIVAALLSGEPDSPEAPMRRIVRTAFAGVMIAVMIGATFGIIGVIRKGGATSWQTSDTIVIDKDSVAIYVWSAATPQGARQLHPMVNLTSARLFLGSDKKKNLSGKSLAGIRRAPLKGIRDAPQSVPAPKDLISGPWTVCARTQSNAPEVTLLAGVAQPGTTLGSDAGVLVAASSATGEDLFVVWKGKRFKIPDPQVLSALGFTSPTPQVVGAAWVNALSQGKDLTFPTIAGRGEFFGDVGGQPANIGQVFKVSSAGTDQYAVALDTGVGNQGKGLAPISKGVAALISAAPGGNRERDLAPSAYTQADKVATPADWARYPPEQLTPAASPILCTGTSGSSDEADPLTVSAATSLPQGAQVVDLRNQEAQGRALADQAYLRAGAAALVRGQGSSKTLFLITDSGKKFPIGDEQALAALGLAKARVANVPQEFLSLMPDGPALSREAAAKVVS